MPYHTKKKIVSKKMTVVEKFKEHKKHHSTKHIKLMKSLMKSGLTFGKSHNVVIKFIK